MSQSTRFGKSLCGLISYDIRVSESAETPGSPANRRTNHERVTFPKAAGWIGLLALAVGLFEVVTPSSGRGRSLKAARPSRPTQLGKARRPRPRGPSSQRLSERLIVRDSVARLLDC